jgi:predicted transcriptional regulator of viral defense system
MSHSATDLLKLLQENGLRVFSSADVMNLTGMSPAAATQALRRLASRRVLYSMKRGLWANGLVEALEPFEAVPHLTAPWTGYVSLQSALSRHGLVEEIPRTIYAVTAGRSARYATPLGQFNIHHLPKHLIWGFRLEAAGRASYPLAEPEKAFLDLAYLGLIPRSPLGMPYKRDRRWKLDLARLSQYARRFKFPPLLEYLRKQKLFKPQ